MHEAPKVVNPLTVTYNKIGKPRLVLLCRHVNHYLHAIKFKHEDIKIAETLFKRSIFIQVVDIIAVI